MVNKKFQKIQSAQLAYYILGSFLIGLALDIFEIALFGEIGLGIVYMPIIGIILGAAFSRDKPAN